MKRILLMAAILVGALFYLTATDYTEKGYFTSDGYVLSTKDVQENLYSDSNGETVEAVSVSAYDTIYQRGKTQYVGDESKTKINLTFPMYLNEGTAVQFLSSGVTLFDDAFTQYDAFEGMILNNGTAFNEDYTRSDWETYYFAKLSNGLYINPFAISVTTYFNKYTIPANSIIYLTPNFIRYYYFNDGAFVSGAIEDVDDTTILRMNGGYITYKDLLLGLGETVEAVDPVIPDQPDPEPEEEPEPEPEVKKSVITPEENPFADPEDPEEDITQTPQTEEEKDIIANYQVPVVTPSNSYKAGVYTLTTTVTVSDPAGVISGGLTYEIIINEGDDKGKVYRRIAVGTDKDTIAVLISGLKPNYNYKLRAYYSYKNKYGKIITPYTVFIDGYEFKTNEVGELGAITLQNFMLSTATISSDCVEIPNLCFSYNESDMDAVSALSKIVIRLNDEDPDTAKGFILDSKSFNSLKDFQAITYTTPKELISNTVYEVEVRCFDRYGNILDMENNTFTTKTCKELPTAKLTVELPELRKAQFLATVSNPDKLEYTNLSLKIYNMDNKLVKEFTNINQNEIIEWQTPGDGSRYIATLTVDCDINDNQGVSTHTIYSSEFSTNSIDRLGSLYLEVSNISKTECPDDMDTRAVLSMRLNTRFTNEELPNYVNYFNITLTSSGGDSIAYTLTDEELAELKAGNTIKIDTANFGPNGLKSSETYTISYYAAYIIDEDNAKDISVSAGLGSLKTKKASVRISMTDVQAYTGFIMAKIKISDIDDVITGDTVLLKIYKYENGSPVELVGSFRITKNETEAYYLKMFNDAAYSSDGCAYNIEGETDYLFRFIAEEAVTDDAAYTSYQLRKDEDSIISTANGITGKIFLYSLDTITDDADHYQANYQVNIDNPNTIIDMDKVYIDIKRHTISGDETIQSGVEMAIEMNAQTTASFNFITEKDKSTADYYYGELYLIINGIRVPLATMQFTTEEPIYTIKTFTDIRNIGTKDRKYVVVNDIDLVKDAGGTDYFAATRNQLNSIIDFQGFSFNFEGSWSVWYIVGQKGAIRNMVYNRYVRLDKRQSYWGSYDTYGGLIYYNYGTIENLNMTYREEEANYEYTNYYSDVKILDHSDEDKVVYQYPRYCSGVINQNYGTLKNFVIEIENYYTCGYACGIVCRDNRGKMTNGYIFGSDKDNEYKATYRLFGSGNSTSYGGVFACSCRDGGSIENIYVLANCDTQRTDTYRGLLVSYNYSVVRNCYTSGHLLSNGSAYIRSYGPAIGYTGDSYINENVYYISDYTYKTDKYNQQVSSAALRNEMWQNSILNSGDGNFNVTEMMNVGCYPQVIYSSKYMPVQKFFELPEQAADDTVDLIFSYEYELGTDEELDAICSPYMTGNEKWTTPDENGDISQSQVAVLLIADPSHQIIHSLKMKDNCIETTILKQVMDGTGVTKLYVAVKNPVQALSEYQVDSIVFEDAYGDKGDEYMLSRSARYINIAFYHQVYGVTGDDSWQHVRKYNAQNHKLMCDLDFSDYTFATEVFVTQTYTGNLDGNGFTIGNIEYDSTQFYKEGFKNESETYSAGIFKEIQGKIFDLTIRDVNIEGGYNAGALAGTASRATFTNVYAVNCYVCGLREAGALCGSTSLSTFECCGVNNVKVLTTGISTDEHVALGGLIGKAGSYTTMLRCYAQNVYLENWIGGDQSSSVGGLIGFINGNQTTITGCYATGVIEALADACGGLVGRIQAVATIDSCYANVDVTVYKSNAGGLVGIANTFASENAGIAFGNIVYGTRYETGADQLNYMNAICYNTDCVSGYAYEGMHVNVNGSDLASTDARTGSKKFTSSELTNGHIFDYINSIYFNTQENFAQGILPRIVDDDGNVLPNQSINYVMSRYSGSYASSLKDSITYSVITSADEDMTQIVINHPSNIIIEKIYTDYSYVDEALGLIQSGVMGDTLGFDSLTSHKTLSYRNSNYKRTAENTTIVLSGMSVEAYYDVYKLTAIKYTDTTTNETKYLNIGEVLAISQKTKDIKDVSDWAAYVAGSLNENFNITGDIDFSAMTSLRFDDEGCANRIIHRLNGQKNNYQTTSDTGFLDYSNGKTDTYYKISNATISHNTDYSRPYGWLNATSCGFIKAITAEITNLTFEKINVTHNASRTAVISNVSGTVKNIVFAECSVTNTANRYITGMIAYDAAYISNILGYKINVSSAGNYTGGLIGIVDHYKYTSGNNLYLIESNVTGSCSYVGGIIGVSGEGTTSFRALTSKTRPTFTNLYVSDSTVHAGSWHTGAAGGYLYGIDLNNVIVHNCDISSYADRAGGVVGTTSGTTITTCEVTNCTIRSTNGSGAGGIKGYGNMCENWIVKDCLITACGGYVGGLIGHLASRDSYGRRIDKQDNVEAMCIVQNSKIYGSYGVGGAVGIEDGGNIWFASIIVDNCDIRGNQDVGGLVGRFYYGGYKGCVVKDSYICPLTDDIIASLNGITTLKISTNASDIRNFGAAYGYGGNGIYDCLFTNCYIGGTTADYVGAIGGKNYKTYNNYWTFESESKGCIVVGKDYVGGLYGSLYTGNFGTSSYNQSSSVTSDALVYGYSNVAGIAGRVYDVYDSENGVYTNAPVVWGLTFTGTLNSTTNAALFFCDAELDHMDFKYLNSLPYYVKCSTFDGIIEDNGSEGRNYNFQDIVESTYIKMFSIWKQTKVIVNGVTSTMSNYITLNYNNYLLTADNPDGFIVAYEDEKDIKTRFYSASYASSVNYKDVTDDDYLPLHTYCDDHSIIMFNGFDTYIDNTSRMTGGTRIDITDLQQGLYIPDISTYYTNYQIDIRNRESIYENGGSSSIGVSGTVGYVAKSTPGDQTATIESEDSTISAYAISAHQVNLDLGNTLADKCVADATIMIIVGEEEVLNESTVNRRTYTLTYDFSSPITVKISYKENEEIKNVEYSFNASDLVRKSMLTSSEGYYIGSDSLLYNVKDSKQAISDKKFVHLYDGEALTADGMLYAVSADGVTWIGNATNTVEQFSEPLYEFTYNDRTIYTFDKYSYIYCNGTATTTNDYRLFVKNGKLLVVNQNNNAVADGVYAYYEGDDSYIAVLTEKGSILTLGTVDLTQRLSGFKNESIVSLSSNMNSSSTTIIFTYSSGQSVGYDVVSGKELFKTTVTESIGLGQYLKNTLTTMFSVTASPLTVQSQQSNGLTDLMNESELTLDQVIELATINDGDAELTVKQIENGTVDASSLSGSSSAVDETIVADDSVAPAIEELTDKVGEENQLPEGYESTLEDEYIAVYNAETEEFDIYNAKEIMTKSDETVSESSRIVDQATLKSLYVTFAEEDTTTSTGAKMYVAVSAIIIVMLIAFFNLRKKEEK